VQSNRIKVCPSKGDPKQHRHYKEAILPPRESSLSADIDNNFFNISKSLLPFLTHPEGIGF